MLFWICRWSLKSDAYVCIMNKFTLEVFAYAKRRRCRGRDRMILCVVMDRFFLIITAYLSGKRTEIPQYMHVLLSFELIFYQLIFI